MLLKSIKLNNIRSYVNEKVDFPTGSLLFAGDIGSGKSTILLAIEFALFGSKPSELPASSLLRHGKKEGFVELGFEIEGKEILIKRTLKRGKYGIKQEVGYIIFNGVKKDLSPVEMKSHVFDLLGYPKDLVSKGKDLIYRYTVYTPQEEMKRILMEEKDTRLNTLRKVFNVDKYKKIKENSVIFIRVLKENKKEIQGFISDLDEKNREKEFMEREFSDLDIKIRNIAPKIENIKINVKQRKENINILENKINELNKMKNDFNIYETELRNLLNERERNRQSLEKSDKNVVILEKELDKEGIKEDKTIKEKISNIEKEIQILNEEMEKIKLKLNEFKINKNKSKEIIDKISHIEKCPLCLQNVEHEHKSSISERENKNILEAEKNIKLFAEKETGLKYRLQKSEKDKEDLRKKENRMELVKLKMKNLNERKEEKSIIEKRQEEIKKNISAVNANKIDLNEKIDKMKDIEENYKNARRDFEIVLEEEKKLVIEKTGLEKEKESLNKIIISLEKEIEKKLKAKEKLISLAKMHNWLEEFFINLMGTMEKHIMFQIHREFNELFKEWFNILIEDETISVRLDDEFTPVIEQNGYETNVESLSGGEKTSVALSYRLALNKVINDIVAEIKTKDILMLDEPTDGFSSEQLDKVRDIINQLKMKQVIIVSHEPKIESYVDNVIHIGKEEHVSSVV